MAHHGYHGNLCPILNMESRLRQLKKEFEKDVQEVTHVSDLEKFEQKYFGRKSGLFSNLMGQLKELTDAKRKELGKKLNEVKAEFERAIAEKKGELQKKELGKIAETEAIDVTQPALPKRERGHVHPVTQSLWDIEDVARSMGFTVEDGPEIESDYYNFTALNIPQDHPARDSMDTLYLKGHPHWCMRTHVSNMQVRLMKKYGVPLRIAYPGRCFRNEATDTRHEHTFYQYECFMIDRAITVADMIGVSREMLRGVFKQQVDIRLRPKYYPFVEPGVNGEVTCTLCSGKGCRVCKFTGWLEVFGAGMIHPAVLRAADIDPKEYGGFAFAFGFTRLVMLKYGIEDIRLLQSGDLRFLVQF